MINLQKIYFDGQGYANASKNIDPYFSNEEYVESSRYNFTPVESIKFINNFFCNITLYDGKKFEGISTSHLYTDISSNNSLKEESDFLSPCSLN